MTIKHAAKTFDGLHGRVIEEMPEIRQVESNFFGLNGTSIILGGFGARNLSCELWLFNNFADFLDINIELNTIDKLVGKFGDLRVTNPADAPDSHKLYKDVVFLGFERQPFPGQEQAVPIPDAAGTVDGGYHIRGILRFRQALVN